MSILCFINLRKGDSIIQIVTQTMTILCFINLRKGDSFIDFFTQTMTFLCFINLRKGDSFIDIFTQTMTILCFNLRVVQLIYCYFKDQGEEILGGQESKQKYPILGLYQVRSTDVRYFRLSHWLLNKWINKECITFFSCTLSYPIVYNRDIYSGQYSPFD